MSMSSSRYEVRSAILVSPLEALSSARLFFRSSVSGTFH